MEMEAILRRHAQMYPDMRPTDAVKLIYQNEFGGGHLITDPKKSLEYLRAEAAGTPSSETLPLSVPIGNGLVRVNIAAVGNYRLELERLNDIFVESAREVKGSLASFLDKLEILKRLAVEGAFSFTQTELEEYLEQYAEKGYPMVSHSAEYRERYAPAYRVVLERLMTGEK